MASSTASPSDVVVHMR
ncbi:TPA_asm: UL43.5 uORF [Human alphaherpesvirus 1]|nr:TPA_asm: UL43.5 uORF [Human alphaherpesvirus 1]